VSRFFSAQSEIERISLLPEPDGNVLWPDLLGRRLDRVLDFGFRGAVDVNFAVDDGLRGLNSAIAAGTSVVSLTVTIAG
jgi:hypothetical protein